MGPAKPANWARVGSLGGCGAGEDLSAVLLPESDRRVVEGEEVGLPGFPGMATRASSAEGAAGGLESSQPRVSMVRARQVIERSDERSNAEFLGLDGSSVKSTT